MATAKPPASPAAVKPVASRQPRRRGRRIASWLAVPAVAAMAWFWQPLHSHATAGASYGARMACSCRHIAGRPLSDCRDDFESGMGSLMLSEDEEARSVTASFPVLASATASFREGEGCVLEKWGG